MKRSEVIKLLENKGGFRLYRHGSNHDLYKNDLGEVRIVPRHSKEIPTGTAKQILKGII